MIEVQRLPPVILHIVELLWREKHLKLKSENAHLIFFYLDNFLDSNSFLCRKYGNEFCQHSEL